MSETIAMPRSKNQALHWLAEHSPVTVASYTELGAVFGWQRAKAWKVIQSWKRKGYVETGDVSGHGALDCFHRSKRRSSSPRRRRSRR